VNNDDRSEAKKVSAINDTDRTEQTESVKSGAINDENRSRPERGTEIQIAQVSFKFNFNVFGRNSVTIEMKFVVAV
jgi:hypothetical protein